MRGAYLAFERIEERETIMTCDFASKLLLIRLLATMNPRKR
jgi:hypothetical protein